MVAAEVSDIHVARMRFCDVKEWNVTKKLEEILQHTELQARYHIEQMEGVKKVQKGDEYLVLWKWQGVDEEDGAWAELESVD